MVFVILRVKCGVNEKKAWYATNFSDEKTIFDLYNEFASGNLDNKSPVNEIQNSRITAHIGTKKSELNTEIDPSTKLCDAVPCLGPYIEYRVNKDVNENCEKNAKADAFTILMQGANKANHLPNIKHELNQKNKLFNDIIEWLRAQNVGFLSTNKDSLGVNLVNTLTDILWYVDGNHHTLASRACDIPEALTHFNGYYKPELRKRKKIDSTSLQENILRSHSTALLLLTENGFLKREKWLPIKTILLEFGQNLKKYADFLVSQQYRTECSASKKVFQGDKERWEYLAPVSNINPTKQ